MTSIIEFLYLCLFFVTPLIFTSITSELFEIPKLYFVYFTTLFILLFHLINTIKGKVPLFVRNKINLPLALFFVFQLISTIYSVDIHTSFFGYYSRLNGGLLSIACYSILLLILNVYQNDKFKQKIISVFLVSGLLVSSFGILEHFGIDKDKWVQDVQSRVFSTFGQPNWLAAYLCILLPFALDKFFYAKTLLQKYTSAFLIINFYLCLLYTKSKSGIIAAIISIAIYFIFYIYKNIFSKESSSKINHIKKEKSPFIKGGWGISIILIIFAILSLSINNPIKDYLFPQKITPPTTQTTTLNITASEDIRKIVWQGSVDLWKRYPFFGTGPETFAYSYYWTRPATHNLTSEWDFLYNKAHNEYLNYLATTGTFGFLSYILLIISILILIINSPVLLSAFISILITNSVGFSVVVTSLFFFLIPTFISAKPPVEEVPKPKNKLFYLPLITIFIFLFIKLFAFLLSDITYNQSQQAIDRQQLTNAKDFINFSIYLRPKEALFYSLASSISAKLGDADTAVKQSNMAISLSPASTNLWKERAQVFSQLSVIDTKYFPYAIDALEKCARLAPTDAKTFYLLGKFYEAANQTELTIKNYQKAIELKSNDDYSAFALGQIYFNQKKYLEAKKYFEITLRYAPTNPDAQNYLDKITSLSPTPR